MEEEKIEKIKEQIEKMEEIVKAYLDAGARERLNNLKLGHPEKYLKVLQLLYQYIVSGRLTRKITEEEFKRLLAALSEKRETKIRIKRV